MDLAIIDVSMPEMDGFELLRRLRGAEETRALPIVMLTASGHEEDRLHALEGGVNDFLTKPTSSIELVETVRRWLHS